VGLLLRGLPLGSLLIWDDEGDGPRRDPAYSFIQHYVDSRAFSFEDEGYIRRYSQRFDFEEIPDSYSLVLDGQQRLTSFYLSLTGSFTTRKHGDGSITEVRGISGSYTSTCYQETRPANTTATSFTSSDSGSLVD